ncbi:putative The fantastic four family protein [Medicago truncatula]|uniref:Fantastic four-like protein n=1 Tax=Medicago truncatula TaxID=3880 RepID=G7K296_MEDTR|nr:protein FANTASTIC FOUR 3 [Medicago truncatula]AES93630.1 fantastic four-like protein [Medicago truncatula]RHN53279.1 putative The fantastic four family protein [Medicago truncatula]
MAAIVCHGLPSCHDSHLVESRFHNIRLPSPKPLTTQPIDLPFKTCFWDFENNINKTITVDSNPKEDSWSSIQSLFKSNASKGLKETTYVDPNVKLPWHRLSPKSLELCTENLGNETGADIPEFSIDLLSSTNSACGNLETKEQKKNSCQNLGGEKMRTKSFPPPLKSMRGSESIRVKPHRENGRLVIELTKVPSTVSCFQAERSNGRLRLSFWNDPEEDENQGFEDVENSPVVVALDAPSVSPTKEEESVKEVVEEEGIDNEKEKETPTRVVECIEKEENGWKVESEVKMERYERGSRRRRCKEGKHENNERLGNWGEPLWLALATS